jgi:hypothetical protein
MEQVFFGDTVMPNLRRIDLSKTMTDSDSFAFIIDLIASHAPGLEFLALKSSRLDQKYVETVTHNRFVVETLNDE